MIRRLCCSGALALALLAASVPVAHATVSGDEWAPKFCTALDEWQTTIAQQADSVQREIQGIDKSDTAPKAVLETAREKLSTFLGDMVSATDDATDAIKDAGKPSTPNGKKISAAFVNGFKAISKEFAKAQARAEKLPVSSVAKFRAKGKALGKALSESGDELSKGFASVDELDRGKQLEAAVKAAPECSFLNS